MATYSGKKRSGSGMGFVDTLADVESSNRNIFSGVDKDVSGPGTKSQGYWQITTPTWQDFAPKAGVDLNRYPNAMSAPREIQGRVAGYIPFGRFGPRTQRLMGARYGNLDKRLTVSQLAAKYGPGSPQVAAAVTADNTPPGLPVVAGQQPTTVVAGGSGDAARRQISPQYAQGPMAAVEQNEEDKDNAYWRNMIAGMNFNIPQPQAQAPVSGIVEPPQQPLDQQIAGLQALGAGPGAAPGQQAPVDQQAQRQQALAALLEQLNAPVRA